MRELLGPAAKADSGPFKATAAERPRKPYPRSKRAMPFTRTSEKLGAAPTRPPRSWSKHRLLRPLWGTSRSRLTLLPGGRLPPAQLGREKVHGLAGCS